MFQSFAFMSRRDFIAAAAMAAAGIVCSSPRGVFAAEPEKRSVTIAVGGKNLYYYLPMALADWMAFIRTRDLTSKRGLSGRIEIPSGCSRRLSGCGFGSV